MILHVISMGFLLNEFCIFYSLHQNTIFVFMEKKIHQGKNITRFRQMLGMKQDVLASLLGDDWTQIKISRLEAKEEIEAIQQQIKNLEICKLDKIIHMLEELKKT